MISSKIKVIRNELEEEKKVMDFKKASTTYQAFWEEYKVISQSINDCCISFLNLNEYTIINNEKEEEVQNLFRNVWTELKRVDIDSPQEMNAIIFDIQTKTGTIKNMLSQEWIEYINENLSGYINMTNVLKKVFDVKDLKYVKNYSEIRKDDFPITNNIVIDFNEMKKKFENAIEKYEMNKNIKYFLIKIGRNEATLNDLDDEILKWFNNMKINDHIKLRLE